jgi:anti-anti-sigma factor
VPGLTITTTLADGTETITAIGDVDGATAAQLRAAIAAAAGARIVVDLTASSYFDRSGLRVLLEFAGKLSEVVVLRNGAVQRLFALVALDQVLQIRIV